MSISDVVDLTSVLQAAQAISSKIQLDELLKQISQIMLQNSSADQCILLFPTNNEWQIRAIATKETTTLVSHRLDNYSELPILVIQQVKNTQEMILIEDLKTDLPVIDDYLNRLQPKSVLCLPVSNQTELVAILYLENQATTGVFTSDGISVIQLLCTQAAISLQNAWLYQQSQQALTDLKGAQLQIVQNEKMLTLGNLLAGLAHEINNPVGFISGNIAEATTSFQDVIDLLETYQEEFPDPGEKIEEKTEEIDLEYLLEDLPKLLKSMEVGCDRIKDISNSLRIFSRTDKDYKVSFNIHTGIDSTLIILKHRIKGNEFRVEIQVIKEYGDFGEIKCFPSQLNQVFMNLITYTVDRVDEMAQTADFNKNSPQVITIKTGLLKDVNQVTISISNPSLAIAEENKNLIFDYSFTSQSGEKGQGLGLAIARQIIVEKHGGNLICSSELGQGTEFIITLPVSD